MAASGLSDGALGLFDGELPSLGVQIQNNSSSSEFYDFRFVRIDHSLGIEKFIKSIFNELQNAHKRNIQLIFKKFNLIYTPP